MGDGTQPCQNCNGSGQVTEVEYVADEMHINTRPCGSCGGTGRQ